MKRTISRILTITLSIAALVATVAPATTHHDSRMSLAASKGGAPGVGKHSIEAPAAAEQLAGLRAGAGGAPKRSADERVAGMLQVAAGPKGVAGTAV